MRPRRRLDPYLLLLPTLLLLFVFVLFPVGFSVYMSLFSWDMLTPAVYVGEANYTSLLQDDELFRIVGRTLFFSLLSVIGSGTIGLLLAVFLNRQGSIFAFARGAIFSAYVVSWVAVALLWMWLLDGDNGLVAALLVKTGLPRIGFLSDPSAVVPTLSAITVWKLSGYAMILFLAGLQSIPKELYEAAALDGASPFRRFRYVTWPMLRPTMAFVVTTTLILSFQAFDVVRIITQGGPAKASTLFVYAIYEQVFLNLAVGKASALTVAFFAILVLLTLLQLRVWKSRVEET